MVESVTTRARDRLNGAADLHQDAPAMRLTITHGRISHATESEAIRLSRAPLYKLVVGVDAPLELVTAAGTSSTYAVLVPPGVDQGIAARGLAVGALMLPGSALAPYVAGRRETRVLEGAVAKRLREIARAHLRSSPSADPDFVDESYRSLRLPQHEVDFRVRCALSRLSAEPALDFGELAKELGLSRERLRHLVVSHTGDTLSTHRLFYRTVHAMERVLAGLGLAAAAHAEGFADHAHFTRSFARLFGRVPSTMSSLEATVLGQMLPSDAVSAARQVILPKMDSQ
jgi:AraC-like DNA-binding protein